MTEKEKALEWCKLNSFEVWEVNETYLIYMGWDRYKCRLPYIFFQEKTSENTEKEGKDSSRSDITQTDRLW